MSKKSPPEVVNFQNHLKNEKSPYLLQHANNPVDWYPWGYEAFNKAKDENKPIFLSIGYSTCHWCHVMARESFQDPEIGSLMNQNFVSVKVDREERPDIDHVYMTVCQMITGSGGWPLTIILTPELKPFFAGTYFPKESGARGVGLKDLILNIKDMWEMKKTDLLKSAQDLTSSLQKFSEGESGDELGEDILKQAFHGLQENFDPEFAGFGSYQKFPTPHHLLFLLRYWKRTGDDEALKMVEKTLNVMRMGGIYDHLGFGFHRYSVDREWIVPHFEKMLYDQALLIIAYTEAHLATGKIKYRETAEEVIEYILRDMQSPEGGFYSAEDADSEGEEGKFYLWTSDEIVELLGPEDAKLFSQIYTVSPEGNFKEETTGLITGKNILYQNQTWEDLSRGLKRSPEELWWNIESAREKLFNAREERTHPHKDDKVLIDWNGLVIVALAIAGKIFDREDYILEAQRALDFILTEMFKEGKLMHRWRDGEAAVDGNLDDYAYLIWGLLELYQATFNSEYLKLAIKLKDHLLDHFWDPEGGFFFIADYSQEVLIRQKEAYDTALPSGNSVMMLNMEKLHLITGNTMDREISLALEKYFSPLIERSPSAFTMFLSGTDIKIGPSFEIVIAGEIDKEDSKRFLNSIQKEFIPSAVLVLKSDDTVLNELIDGLEGKSMINMQVTAYVCGDGTCYAPINSPEELINFLKNNQ